MGYGWTDKQALKWGKNIETQKKEEMENKMFDTQDEISRPYSRTYTPRFTQAARFIDKAGGVTAMAKLLGVARTSVYNWVRPVDKGGTDGLIPSSAVAKVIFAFDLNKIYISAYDWDPR